MSEVTDCTHIVIARAAGPNAESESVEARVAFTKEPTLAAINQVEGAVADEFLSVFGTPAARVGTALLPFVLSLDADEEDEDDDLDTILLPYNEPLDDQPEWDAGWPPQ